MHELSLCQALIRQVESVARREGAQRVTAVHLRVGPLSGVVPQLLESAWEFASAGTVAEQSGLVIESMPVRVRCEDCGTESTVAQNELLCDRCNGWHTRIISGDELVLTSVEIVHDTSTEAGAS